MGKKWNFEWFYYKIIQFLTFKMDQCQDTVLTSAALFSAVSLWWLRANTVSAVRRSIKHTAHFLFLCFHCWRLRLTFRGKRESEPAPSLHSFNQSINQCSFFPNSKASKEENLSLVQLQTRLLCRLFTWKVQFVLKLSPFVCELVIPRVQTTRSYRGNQLNQSVSQTL